MTYLGGPDDQGGASAGGGVAGKFGTVEGLASFYIAQSDAGIAVGIESREQRSAGAERVGKAKID